jgi:hypothetical protein
MGECLILGWQTRGWSAFADHDCKRDRGSRPSTGQPWDKLEHDELEYVEAGDSVSLQSARE